MLRMTSLLDGVGVFKDMLIMSDVLVTIAASSGSIISKAAATGTLVLVLLLCL